MGCVWFYMEKEELRYWLEHSDEKNMNKLVELLNKSLFFKSALLIHRYQRTLFILLIGPADPASDFVSGIHRSNLKPCCSCVFY